MLQFSVIVSLIVRQIIHFRYLLTYSKCGLALNLTNVLELSHNCYFPQPVNL